LAKAAGRYAVLKWRQLRPDLRLLLTSGYREGNFVSGGLPDRPLELLQKLNRRKALAERLPKALDT